MRTLQLLILLLIPTLFLQCDTTVAEGNKAREDHTEKTYLINTQNDFDKWSNFQFPAGSKVLFAAGKTFTGQFILKGSGTEAAPNLAAAYDPETDSVLTEWTDNKPLIKGEGKVGSALKLSNGSFWEINNIEVTNTDGTKDQQGEILGIKVVAKDVGLAEDITVKNCYVHDVNGDVGGKYTGGIHVYVLGDSVKTKFHNVTIDNNLISHIGGVGIANQSSYGNITSDNYYPWTEYVVRNNRVEYTGRNGIIVRYAIDPLVEYNVAAYNSRYEHGHSIFNFNTINCIVQYNEAYGNTDEDPTDVDRGGFDCDFNSKNTIYQYNYSHDNNWFIAIQERSLNHGVTIRYNISENERLGAYMYGFPEYDDLTNVKIYNNTHYFGEGMGNRIFVAVGKDRIPTQTVFSNNIFYFEDEAEWGFDPDSSCILRNNVFYNVAPKGMNPITADPLFVNSGQGGTDIDMTDPDRLSGYKLKAGSPALNAGVKIPNNGGKNFGGEKLNDGPVNVGAW